MESTHEYADATDAAMSMLGVTHMAYIRQVDNGYAVYAADGTQLAVFESRDAAFFTARQHNLEPVNIN